MPPETELSGYKILFLAQLPPPFHGQSNVARSVYDIFTGLAGVTVTHKWRGGARGQTDIGRRSLSKALAFLSLLAELIIMFARGKRFDAGYIGMAPWAHTALRDALLIYIAKHLCRQCFIHIHGQGLEDILTAIGWRNRFIRHSLRNTQALVLTQPETARLKQYALFRHIHHLPNAVKDPQITPSEHKQFTIHRPLHIGCLGNLDPRKGSLEFIHCIAALKSADLPVKATVIGAPSAALNVEQLQHYAGKYRLADTVTITGRVEEQVKSQLLSDIDVFLYLSKHDLAPLALIEALAHECIPIIYDIGGMVEMIGDELSENVLPPDIGQDDLTNAVTSLITGYIQSPETVLTGKHRARARYQACFTPDLFRKRLMEIFSLTGQPGQ